MATINKSDMELIVNGASFLASGGGGGVGAVFLGVDFVFLRGLPVDALPGW